VADPWEALAAKNRTALLTTEAHTLATLRQTVTKATDRAVAHVARAQTTDRRATAERGADVLRTAATDLHKQVEASLLGARGNARKAATARVDDEWALVRREVRQHGFRDPGPLPRVPALQPTDRAAAGATAAGYAAAWTHATTGALWDWAADEDADTSPGAAVAAAADGLDYRVKRIATTENAQAYNDARDDVTAAEAKRNDGATWLVAVLKRWDATLDKRVCKVCRDMHGALAIPGLKFRGGREPGHVHVGCRCSDHLVFIPGRIPPLSSEAA